MELWGRISWRLIALTFCYVWEMSMICLGYGLYRFFKWIGEKCGPARRNDTQRRQETYTTRQEVQDGTVEI